MSLPRTGPKLRYNQILITIIILSCFNMIFLNDKSGTAKLCHIRYIRPIRGLDLLDESGEYGMNREYLEPSRLVPS